MPESKEKNSEKLSRQIRKEVASAVQPLLETVATLKEEIALLKQQIGAAAPSASGKEKKEKKEKTPGKSEVAKLRRKLKLSKQEFAELFGVSQEEIKSWENGESKPAGEMAQLFDKLMAMNKKERAAFLEVIAQQPQEER